MQREKNEDESYKPLESKELQNHVETLKIQPIQETLTSSVTKKSSKGVTAEGNPIQYEEKKIRPKGKPYRNNKRCDFCSIIQNKSISID